MLLVLCLKELHTLTTTLVLSGVLTDAIVDGNTFHDTEYLDVWFYLNAYAENDAVVTDNVFTGSTNPGYNVYIQDRTTTGLVVDGNTFSNGQEPIYMRGRFRLGNHR